jgi:hypothetical protein
MSLSFLQPITFEGNFEGMRPQAGPLLGLSTQIANSFTSNTLIVAEKMDPGRPLEVVPKYAGMIYEKPLAYALPMENAETSQQTLLDNVRIFSVKRFREPSRSLSAPLVFALTTHAAVVQRSFSEVVADAIRATLPQIESVQIGFEVDPEDGQRINVITITTSASPAAVIDAEDRLYDEVRRLGRSIEWVGFAISYRFLTR